SSDLDYEVKLPDSLNILKLGLVLLSDDRMVLKDVSLIPRYGDYLYHRKVGFQTDVAKVQIPEVVFEGLNVEKLIGDNMLEAGSVTVTGAEVDVFRDKRYDFEPDITKGMPQELMMNGQLEIKLDSLIIQNADVIYREFPDKGFVPGELAFMDLNAVIAPFVV